MVHWLPKDHRLQEKSIASHDEKQRFELDDRRSVDFNGFQTPSMGGREMILTRCLRGHL